MCSLQFDSLRIYSAYDRQNNLIYSGQSTVTSLPYGSKIYMSAAVAWYSSLSSDNLNQLNSFNSGAFHRYVNGHSRKGFSASGYLVSDIDAQFVTASNPFTAEGNYIKTPRNTYTIMNLTSETLTQSPSTMLHQYSSADAYGTTFQWTYLSSTWSGVLDMQCVFSIDHYFVNSSKDQNRSWTFDTPHTSTSGNSQATVYISVPRYSPAGVRSGKETFNFSSYGGSSYWHNWERGYPIRGPLSNSDTTAHVTITGVAP
jgi:hypothetical protein